MNNRQANAIVKMLDALRSEIRANTNAQRAASAVQWGADVTPFQAYAEELAQQAHTDLAIDEEGRHEGSESH